MKECVRTGLNGTARSTTNDSALEVIVSLDCYCVTLPFSLLLPHSRTRSDLDPPNWGKANMLLHDGRRDTRNALVSLHSECYSFRKNEAIKSNAIHFTNGCTKKPLQRNKTFYFYATQWPTNASRLALLCFY